MGVKVEVQLVSPSFGSENTVRVEIGVRVRVKVRCFVRVTRISVRFTPPLCRRWVPLSYHVGA